MTFEEVLPALKSKKFITRRNLFGNLQIVECSDKKIRLRIWRSSTNFPYKIEAADLLADDWKVVAIQSPLR